MRQLFLTYPDLGGIGLTTGENMRGANSKEKERWAFETYGRGVLDAINQLPGRKITFIHRQHQTGADNVIKQFRPLIEHPDIDFIFSFKYAKAHVYSCTTQPYHHRFVEEIKKAGVPTIWTLRNDDVFYFRWGAPDFVREFIRNIPYEVSRGYYFGSDHYIWGREFTSTEPEHPRQLEVEKHWYHWMLWGRLGYDPNLSNERFEQILAARFPQVSGRDLFRAWQEASLIYPTVTGFHWGALDFQWYIEGCKSHPKRSSRRKTGFHSVREFINLKPHPCTGYLSIPDFVTHANNGKSKGKTPFQIADEIEQHAQRALSIVQAMDPNGNKELRLTLGDIRIIACMGMYYAHKIRGATWLAMFQHDKNNTASKQSAIAELNKAAHWWREFVSHALAQYKNPMWMNRVGIMDWRKMMPEVLNDIRLAGGTPQLESMKPTPGGRIFKPVTKNATSSVFEIQIATPGVYALEFSYALDQGEIPVDVKIDGKSAGNLVLWSTGGPHVLGWDRMHRNLSAGKHRIEISGQLPHIEHLNIISLQHAF